MEITLNFKEIYTKLKLLLTAPRKFIELTKKEESWMPALAYYSLISLIGILLTSIFNFGILPTLDKYFPNVFDLLISQGTFASYIPFLIWSYFAGLILSIIWAGIFMLWTRIFGAKFDYARSYKSFTYSRTPSLLFGWMPYLNLVAWFWGVYLLYLHLREVYGFSKVRALFSLLVGISILAIMLYFLIATYQNI